MNARIQASLLLAVTARLVVSAEGGPLSKFKITTRKPDDTVEVREEKGRTFFVVKSPFGISQAVIERQEQTWPKVVVLRLHLKGLENFKVAGGKLSLSAAVAVREGKAEVRLWKDDKEDAPLDEKSPCWMDVRVLDKDGKPAREVPLKGGYFEITLPAVLFNDNPKSITLSWIDFYRN
jgi:hypothetical protein